MRVFNEFTERMKNYTKTIFLFLNLREILSLSWLDRAFIESLNLEEKAPVNHFGRTVPSGKEYGCK